MPTTHRPHASQPLLGLHREWNLGIRIHGLYRHLCPLPERREVKPPGLPVLREPKIAERILAGCRLAGVQVLVVRKIRPPKHARSSERKPMTNQPSSDDRLDSLSRVDFLLIDVRPERDSLTPRMGPAQRVSQEGSRATLVCGPLPPHSRADHLVNNTETCAENGSGVRQPSPLIPQHKMSTSAIVSVSTLDASKVSFGDIRMNKAGGKTVPIKYNGQSLQIRIPKSTYPMGINIRETDNGSTYQMALTLKGCDVFAKAKAGPEAGDLGSLYNFLLDMQEKLLDVATANSAKWFGRSRERAVLQDLMKQFVSPSVEKINGEWVATGKYPPSFRMKVPVYDGQVSMDVADSTGKPVVVDLENISQIFPKRVEASVVVTPSVYVSGQGFGVTWRVTHARVAPPQRLTAAQVFADEIEEETSAPAVSAAAAFEEEIAPAEAPAPEPVREVIPAAPAAGAAVAKGGNRRRQVAAAV